MTVRPVAGGWETAHRRSLADPNAFWLDAAGAVSWERPPTVGLDKSTAPLYRWFPDGRLNTCYNALDRHVAAGRGDQPAIIYHSASGPGRSLTYTELTELTARFAGVLRAHGVHAGDRVLIYLPMVPEAVVAMLACARLGAVHSVVFGGFGAAELATRIDDAQPTVVVLASCGLEPGRVIAYKPLMDAALARTAHRPQSLIVLQRPELRADLGPGEHDWDEVMAAAVPADCVPVTATDPLYVLYTSGTTGRPKGIVRDNGGHAVAMTWSMRHIYDIDTGDVFWAASDIGWVVGHSYIVYAPLLSGATTVVYEGKPVGTPDAGAFWRVIEQHRVKALFTAPTAVRAVRRADPDGAFARSADLTSLQTLFLAGERLDPDTYAWASTLLDIPVVDHWWQTETGWAICANPRGLDDLPIKPGSPSVPMPGYDVRILDDTGHELPARTDGAIAIRMPLPPGTLTTLWNADAWYADSYLRQYPGYYLSGDGGYIDRDGYVFVMGRTDDVINVAGHRLSTGSIEAVVAAHPAVAECAVIGVADTLKGQLPRALVVLKAGVDLDPQTLADQIVASVREAIGPVAAFRDVAIVDALPKTRSGKILRRTMRDIADGKHPDLPPTIENPDVLTELRPLLRPTP